MKVKDILTGLLFAALVVLNLFAIFGCDQTPDPHVIPKVDGVSKSAELSQRFTLESHGSFNAGYDNIVHEVLIITDKKTGKEYLTVTGCGTADMDVRTGGKGQETVEEK